MVIMRFALLSAMAVLQTADASSRRIINSSNGDIRLNSDIGQNLMQHARALNDNNQGDMDVSFLADYSVKFQGCHHVQQWNSNADDDNDVRIKTKRLIRFRLCKSEDCASSDSSGCTTKYGDYVVDMNTFVGAFLNAKANDDGSMCDDASSECMANCGEEDEECTEACYQNFGYSSCLDDDGNRRLENNFDPLDYAACAQFNMGRRLSENNRALEDEALYYIGPYCADQGGEVHMGLFTDDTCTTFAQNGESTFYNAMGFALPYSDSSLVTQLCLRCGDGGNDDANDNEAELNEMCEDIYYLAGKCETRMEVDYPNESSCSYIKGIKIIRKDGVIRTSSTKKSKAAAACIGLFLTIAVLLAGYVYYLRTKLSRARVNLAAASQTLA